MTIPIGAALSFKGSNTMSWYAGASVLWMQLDPAPPDASDTVSESDPVLFGGLNLASGPLSWTFGGQLVMGDETEFGIVIGAQMNQGVNAIRSLFRRK